MSTDVAVRDQTFDLTRAPQERWNKDMIEVVAKNVFRGKTITEPQLFFCLAIAESLNLNPLTGEVYFIPGKSSDGQGPAYLPYIGRNGLVKKATERGYYYESDTVHENDKFRIVRGKDGERTCTHSYGHGDRGAIVGAYAFLHRRGGGETPSFFYAPWDEYVPTFDADWKLAKSPWGNQSSAMIEKCAMIGAGRKRLDMGNVLADGEIERVMQQQEVGPSSSPMVTAGSNEFDFATLTDDAELVDRLRAGAEAAEWTAAKCEMSMTGRSHDHLVKIAEHLETLNRSEPVEPPDAEEEIADAEVVHEPLTEEQQEHQAALQLQITDLEDRMRMAAPDSEEAEVLQEEIDRVGAELAALNDPDQTTLL